MKSTRLWASLNLTYWFPTPITVNGNPQYKFLKDPWMRQSRNVIIDACGYISFDQPDCSGIETDELLKMAEEASSYLLMNGFLIEWAERKLTEWQDQNH